MSLPPAGESACTLRLGMGNAEGRDWPSLRFPSLRLIKSVSPQESSPQPAYGTGWQPVGGQFTGAMPQKIHPHILRKSLFI